jgi:hypothetical protein
VPFFSSIVTVSLDSFIKNLFTAATHERQAKSMVHQFPVAHPAMIFRPCGLSGVLVEVTGADVVVLA